MTIQDMLHVLSINMFISFYRRQLIVRMPIMKFNNRGRPACKLAGGGIYPVGAIIHTSVTIKSGIEEASENRKGKRDEDAWETFEPDDGPDAKGPIYIELLCTCLIASLSLLYTISRCSGMTLISASTGMKFVSPSQRGTI